MKNPDHIVAWQHFPSASHKTLLAAFKLITWFWFPLLITWLLMAVEGPFIAATIARFPDNVVHLAAFGTSFSIALLLEAPVIMMMSLAPALLRGWESYLDLRRYCTFLLVLVTGLVGLFLIPAVANFMLYGLLQLPDPVAVLVYQCVFLMIPWPAAIGYRRFYQGILIVKGSTQKITLGTMFRIVAMLGTCFFMSRHLDAINMAIDSGILAWRGLAASSRAVNPTWFHFSGSTIGAFALSTGVVIEACAVRFFARSTLRFMEIEKAPPDTGHLLAQNPRIHWQDFWRFYGPLMMTALISLGLPPLINFFVGGSYRALESLAVLPIFNSLAFIFRCFSLSFQDVVLSLSKKSPELHRALRFYANAIAGATALMLAIISWSPILGDFWLKNVCGLEENLAEIIRGPLKFLPPYALFSMALSFGAARAMLQRQTRAITLASVAEVFGAVSVLLVGALIAKVNPDQTWLTGISCAGAAIVFGRGVGAYVLYSKIKGPKHL